jgi:hypothetical protein
MFQTFYEPITIFKYCYHFLPHDILELQPPRDRLAKKRKAKEEGVEGETTRTTDKATEGSGGVRNTKGKRSPEEAAKISERQNGFRNLSDWIDICGLRSVAVQQ